MKRGLHTSQEGAVYITLMTLIGQIDTDKNQWLLSKKWLNFIIIPNEMRNLFNHSRTINGIFHYVQDDRGYSRHESETRASPWGSVMIVKRINANHK